jgi:hypothetical protein
VSLNVQQTIQQTTKSKKFYLDTTTNGSLFWNITGTGVLDPPQPSPFPPGQFVAVAPGCACITAQVANIVSCPIAVEIVGGSPCPVINPCPTPAPLPNGQVCPGPIPTPTPQKHKTPTPSVTPTATSTP